MNILDVRFAGIRDSAPHRAPLSVGLGLCQPAVQHLEVSFRHHGGFYVLRPTLLLLSHVDSQPRGFAYSLSHPRDPSRFPVVDQAGSAANHRAPAGLHHMAQARGWQTD